MIVFDLSFKSAVCLFYVLLPVQDTGGCIFKKVIDSHNKKDVPHTAHTVVQSQRHKHRQSKKQTNVSVTK